MDGELLEKAKSIFGGVFLIWRRPARLWNSSTEKFCNPNGEDANARGGAADRGEHRQAAGVIAKAVMRGRGELGHLTLDKIKNHKTRPFLARQRTIVALESMQAIKRPSTM
jgi:hypothetical protein